MIKALRAPELPELVRNTITGRVGLKYYSVFGICEVFDLDDIAGVISANVKLSCWVAGAEVSEEYGITGALKTAYGSFPTSHSTGELMSALYPEMGSNEAHDE